MNEQQAKNLQLWNSVFTTDPTAVKEINGKQYKGHSPDPYWIIEQATKHFGAAGIGWGVEVVSQQFQQVSTDDWLHTAVVRVWYMQDGKRGHVEHIGGTKAAYKTSAGKIMVDEDAAKKSVTDGMVKALSMLGFAGDIFSGAWDRDNYVDHAGAIHKEQRNETERQRVLDTQLNPLLEKVRSAKTREEMDEQYKKAVRLANQYVNVWPDLKDIVLSTGKEAVQTLKQLSADQGGAQ